MQDGDDFHTSPETPFRDALLNAYKLKYELAETSDSNLKRKTLAPLHKSNTKTHNKQEEIDRWWTKPPALAGESCTTAQRRLCEVDTFTGMYKKRFLDPNGSLSIAGSGDFCDRPIRATRLLNSTEVSKLTIPRRAGDYRNEVEWRLLLRPQFN